MHKLARALMLITAHCAPLHSMLEPNPSCSSGACCPSDRRIVSCWVAWQRGIAHTLTRPLGWTMCLTGAWASLEGPAPLRDCGLLKGVALPWQCLMELQAQQRPLCALPHPSSMRLVSAHAQAKRHAWVCASKEACASPHQCTCASKEGRADCRGF